MPNRTAFAALALVLLTPSLGLAQERYRLEKTAEGYVRMDTQTGAMSICRESEGALTCEPAKEDRTGDAAALATRVEALEARVAKLENSLAARMEKALPSEEDFDRTLSMMERFLRGFVGVVRELDREPGQRT